MNNHDNMILLQEDNASISYVLDNAIQVGDEIIYKLIMNNGQFDIEKTISKTYGNPSAIFTDNGNSITNYSSTNWNTTTSEYYSASSSITDSPFGNYNDNENSNIELNNAIDLSNTIIAQVSFYAKWDLESGWDYVQFEISTDNGTTWVPQCGNYTSDGVPNQGIEGEPMYDGVQNNWVLEEVNLSDYLGEQIKFRFNLVSDTTQTRDGFYFDDFEIKVISDSTTSVNDNDYLNVSIYPNPTNSLLNIEIPNISKETNINIYSISGQLVKSLNTNVIKTKLDISSFATGIYFVQLKSENAIKSYKIIKK
jgi:hypothetical protein